MMQDSIDTLMTGLGAYLGPLSASGGGTVAVVAAQTYVQAVSPAAVQWSSVVVDREEVVGEYLRLLSGAPVAATTWTALAASDSDLAAVVGSSTAMAAVAASSTAMAAVIASSTAMAAVVGSSTAMAAVIASPAALAAVIASPAALAAVVGSQIARVQVRLSASARAAINNSAAALDVFYSAAQKITSASGNHWPAGSSETTDAQVLEANHLLVRVIRRQAGSAADHRLLVGSTAFPFSSGGTSSPFASANPAVGFVHHNGLVAISGAALRGHLFYSTEIAYLTA